MSKNEIGMALMDAARNSNDHHVPSFCPFYITSFKIDSLSFQVIGICRPIFPHILCVAQT
jgi:hypothetical protein